MGSSFFAWDRARLSARGTARIAFAVPGVAHAPRRTHVGDPMSEPSARSRGAHGLAPTRSLQTRAYTAGVTRTELHRRGNRGVILERSD